MKTVGIDLAGREKNPSGIAVLARRRFNTELLYTDEELIEFCARERPRVVAIDSPLSLPKRGSLRLADRSLIKRGLRVFPPTFAGMRSLTQRGIRLSSELRARGFEVIEIHPRTSGLVLFGNSDRLAWVRELRKRGWWLKSGASEHEIDAAMGALTGMLYLQGKIEEVGASAEGTIVIPSIDFLKLSHRNARSRGAGPLRNTAIANERSL